MLGLSFLIAVALGAWRAALRYVFGLAILAGALASAAKVRDFGLLWDLTATDQATVAAALFAGAVFACAFGYFIGLCSRAIYLRLRRGTFEPRIWRHAAYMIALAFIAGAVWQGVGLQSTAFVKRQAYRIPSPIEQRLAAERERQRQERERAAQEASARYQAKIDELADRALGNVQ